MKLMLGICAGEHVPASFIREFWMLMHPDPLPLAMADGIFVQRNRNRIVKSALETQGWDRLLFVDTDMLFTPGLREIAESWEDPIVGALYFRRRWPDYNPVPGYRSDEKSYPMYQAMAPHDVERVLKEPGLHPVDILGTGCMGIRRDVLEMWAEEYMPWFQMMHSADGQIQIGEDVMFCQHAVEQGIELKLDSRVQCGHQGTITIGAQTYAEMLLEAPTEGTSDEGTGRPNLLRQARTGQGRGRGKDLLGSAAASGRRRG